jgi:hypothetical protein
VLFQKLECLFCRNQAYPIIIHTLDDRAFIFRIYMFKTYLRRNNRRPQIQSAAAPAPAIAKPANEVLRSGRAVALVDARFLSWLFESSGDSAAMPVSTGTHLMRQLDTAARQTGLELDFLRAYWYTDQAPAAPVDDVLQRHVLDTDADGGYSLVRAISADLEQLAQNRAVEHVVLLCDDERLLAAVDTAQLFGLGVHMVVDEAGADHERLLRDDPVWARLLAQADRRIVLSLAVKEGLAAVAAQSSSYRENSSADQSAMQAQIMADLQTWWAEEPETQRIDLQDELQFSRNIPQEVDRQLLLRLSRVLGHPLTWPEKKIMREGVRRIVLGDEYTPYKPASAADSMPGSDVPPTNFSA